MNIIYKWLLREVAKNIIAKDADIWNGGWKGKYNIFLESDVPGKYYRLLSIDGNKVTCDTIENEQSTGENKIININDITNKNIKLIARHGKTTFHSLGKFFLFDIVVSPYAWLKKFIRNLINFKLDNGHPDQPMAIELCPDEKRHREAMTWAQRAYWASIISIVMAFISILIAGGLIKSDCAAILFHDGLWPSIICVP